MMQNRLGIWLGVMACVVTLGAGAGLVYRTANPGQMAPETRDATPSGAAAPRAVDAAPMSSAMPAPGPSDASIAAEEASREASWREAREAAIRVQQRLRAEQQARKSAEREETKNERCVSGQRMKRVENGWVQAGNC